MSAAPSSLGTAHDRAARGAATLDSKRPGWANEITGRLDLWSHCCCVLGKLYGRFGTGVGLLSPTDDDEDWARDQGFIPLRRSGDAERLERAWTAEIRVRTGELG